MWSVKKEDGKREGDREKRVGGGKGVVYMRGRGGERGGGKYIYDMLCYLSSCRGGV